MKFARFIYLRICLFFLLPAILAGCSLVKLNFGSSISPLEEKVISGEGETKVLILNIEGFISNQKKRSLMGTQTDVGMVERVRETLEKAAEEKDIKALVLKINTPGGTVTSSDIIYHEIERFKEDQNIPVYAWVVDLAASGGYYIAQSADKILAHPTSITGSIGVITVKVNLEGLMDKVGVDWEVIKSGDKKDFLSPFRAITAEERELFQETIDHFYKRFVSIIAKNRKTLTEDQVKSLADGRVFSSKKALDLNLIDQIAYRDEAIGLIKKDLGVKDFKLVTYQRSGEYKSNMYSSMPGQPVINLVNLNMNFLPENPGPHFFYLWMP